MLNKGASRIIAPSRSRTGAIDRTNRLTDHSLSEHGIFRVFVDLGLVLDVLGAVGVPEEPREVGEDM